MTVAASVTPPTTDAWIRGPIEDSAEIRRALAAALQRWRADGPSTYRLTYEIQSVDFNQITMDATVVDGVVPHADATLDGQAVAPEYRTPQHFRAGIRPTSLPIHFPRARTTSSRGLSRSRRAEPPRCVSDGRDRARGSPGSQQGASSQPQWCRRSMTQRSGIIPVTFGRLNAASGARGRRRAGRQTRFGLDRPAAR